MDQQPFGEFGTNDFAENPEPRVPCLLVLDVSTSMQGSPIAELNNGIQAFKEELSSDGLAAKRVEAGIITFGQSVDIQTDFTTAEGFIPPSLEVSGMTPMGEAVNQAIDLIETRKATYKENGIAYYRPWIFLITDGAPTDDYKSSASRSKRGDADKAFAFFSIGVGNADFNVLAEFSNREPLRLKGLEFRKLFQWLSSSLKSVSRSTPGDEVPLSDPTTPNGWASV